MNNKTIVEFGFRIIWRIMEISEGIIRPGWLKPSLISIILQMILNVIHFDITTDILHTSPYTSQGTNEENLLNYPELLHLLIISFILSTFMIVWAVSLQGEVSDWSPLEVEELERFSYDLE